MKVSTKRVYSKRKLPTPTVSEIKRSKEIPKKSAEEAQLNARTYTREELEALDEILDQQTELNEGLLIIISKFLSFKQYVIKK